MTAMIVTVDGPSGTGKSTVSKEVAARSGLPHLDTGAFYRAATLAAIRSGVDLDDDEAVTRIVEKATLDQIEGSMMLDGRSVDEEIRGETVTGLVSRVSAIPAVRSLLVEAQRQWVEMRGKRAVVEGRDIGSVVFPDANLKVYLDARPEVRAERRGLQIGEDPSSIIDDLKRRDHADSTRQASPLSVPEGSVVVDTSDLSFEEVVSVVLGLLAEQS